MGNRINPGIGGSSPAERRLAEMERFFGRFALTRISTITPDGQSVILLVLASPEGPGLEPATAVTGAFFGVTQVKGKWTLEGGQVSAGNMSEAVDPIELAKVGSEPKDDELHWLQITGDGVVTNGRLQSSFNLKKVTDGKGTTLPALTLPTKTALKERSVYLLLGSWQGKRFAPAQAGNVTASFCVGQGYTISRG